MKNKDGSAYTGTGVFTWSTVDSPTYVTIVSQTNTTCVLKGVKYKIVTLNCTDGTNTYIKNIQVQNGW